MLIEQGDLIELTNNGTKKKHKGVFVEFVKDDNTRHTVYIKTKPVDTNLDCEFVLYQKKKYTMRKLNTNL